MIQFRLMPNCMCVGSKQMQTVPKSTGLTLWKEESLALQTQAISCPCTLWLKIRFCAVLITYLGTWLYGAAEEPQSKLFVAVGRPSTHQVLLGNEPQILQNPEWKMHAMNKGPYWRTWLAAWVSTFIYIFCLCFLDLLLWKGLWKLWLKCVYECS